MSKAEKKLWVCLKIDIAARCHPGNFLVAAVDLYIVNLHLCCSLSH